jgi:hypothetical protein
MKMEIYEVQIKFLREILGSLPNKEVFEKFLAPKALEEGVKKERIAEEMDNLPSDEEIGAEDNSMSRFARTEKGPFIYENVIMGFLKNSGDVLKTQLGIAALKSKIEDFVSIAPIKNYFTDANGNIISKVDELTKDRTKSINAKFGEKLSVLGSSEKISHANLKFYIMLIENKATKQSGAVTGDVIQELLEYGRLKGLGQWRNAGYGSFEVTSFKKIDMSLSEWTLLARGDDDCMDEDVVE